MNVPDVLLVPLAFGATAVGVWAYRSLAVRRGIVANPSFRGLHDVPIPRGGGIVITICAVSASAAASSLHLPGDSLAWAIVAGGLVAGLFGFVDDVFDVAALAKLAVQAALAAWILLRYGASPLFDLPLTPVGVDLAVSWLSLVWLMNVYNFIDGIDGLAASGAVMICATSIVVLMLGQGNAGITLQIAILAACSLGFLVFNWPPATIFMGDAGSLFLGFCFSAIAAGTITTDQIPLSVWLIMFGYYAGDTTTTTVVRIMITEKWYGQHRSHAYQNLARLSGSHLAVLRGVCAYHIVWLLPLAVSATLWPSFAPFGVILALGPVVLWTLCYGPILSSS